MLRLRLVALCLLVTQLARAAPPAAELDAAEAAVRELRYDDARATLGRLLKAGGLQPADLAGVYALSAEITAVVDGPEAAEREYRRLLVLDPQRTKPRRDTPVFSLPFERARKWVQAAGALAVAHTPPERAVAGAPIELPVTVASDPLAMVWGVRAMRQGEGGLFEALEAQPGTRATLPPAAQGAVAYFLEVLDENRNVVRQLGADAEPFRVPVVAEAVVPPPERARPARRLWRPALGVGVAGLLVLGAAIGLDAESVAEYGRLEESCAPVCSPRELDTLNLERNLAAAFYAVGAAAVATGIVLFIVDRVRR